MKGNFCIGNFSKQKVSYHTDMDWNNRGISHNLQRLMYWPPTTSPSGFFNKSKTVNLAGLFVGPLYGVQIGYSVVQITEQMIPKSKII